MKNIELKSSENKNEKVILTDNALKIIQNKQIVKIFLYSEILKLDVCISAHKHTECHGYVRGRFLLELIINLNNAPDCNDISVSIDFKTQEYNHTLFLKTTLKTAFELVKLNNYIKNFYLETEEEKCIKNCIAIPLTFYASNGTKLDTLGYPFSSIELAACCALFFPFALYILASLIIIFILGFNDYIQHTGSMLTSFNYVILPGSVFGLFGSLLAIINEIKKVNLRKNISKNIVTLKSRNTDEARYVKNSIIIDNKVNISQECYKYICTNRYVCLLLFVFNLFFVVFTTSLIFIDLFETCQLWGNLIQKSL